MIYLPAAPGLSWARKLPKRVGIGFVILIAALVWYLSMAAGLTLVLGGLAVMALIAVLAWCRPAPTAAFFLAFVPVNRFVLVLIYYATHQDLLIKGLELWKEGLVVVLLARGIHDALVSREAKRIMLLDLVVLAYLIISLGYIAYDGPGHILTPIDRIQGWRTDSSFMLAYFAGRGLIVNRGQLKWILVGVLPGCILLGLVAIWQFALPAQANDFFQAVGANAFSSLSGDVVASSIRDRSIPGLNLPRASSLMLGDLALAFYQLTAVALGAALYFLAKGKQAFWAGAFLLLMVGTLVLTVTRSAILALPIMICLAAILSGRWLRLLPLIGVLVVAAVIGIELSNLRLELLPRLWDFSEGSTQTHIALLQESSSIISGFPWGHGLGTGGTIGTRNLGTLAIDNENWLLLLATDMGVVPALLFLVINVAVTLVCLRAFLGVRDLWLRVMTLTVGVGAIGYLFVGNFLHSWENLVVSMGFWLLAGVAVRARDLQSKPGFVGTAALAVSNPR